MCYLIVCFAYRWIYTVLGIEIVKKKPIDSWNLVWFEDIELCLDCWFVNVWTSIMGEKGIKSCLGLLTGKILSYLAHNSFCLSTKESIFIHRSLWVTGVKFTRVWIVVGNPSCLKQSINFRFLYISHLSLSTQFRQCPWNGIGKSSTQIMVPYLSGKGAIKARRRHTQKLVSDQDSGGPSSV